MDVDSFSLSPGWSRDVLVSFMPGATGESVGTLTITSNDPDEPIVRLTLRGEGQSQSPVVWEQTNGPRRGSVLSLAINSNGDIFAGTEGGGVFRSTDNGDNWAAINTGLTDAAVNALPSTATATFLPGLLSAVCLARAEFFARRTTATTGAQSILV